MSKEEEMIAIMEKLLNITNSYVDSYCETYDEYVLNEDEIAEIEDEEERERAKDLKETDDFLMKVAIYIEEYNKEHSKQSEEEEEICEE